MTAPQAPDISHWARDYVKQEQSSMRGGRRMKSRDQVKRDIAAAFPGSGALYFIWLAWWAFQIWRMLKKGNA